MPATYRVREWFIDIAPAATAFSAAPAFLGVDKKKGSAAALMVVGKTLAWRAKASWLSSLVRKRANLPTDGSKPGATPLGIAKCTSQPPSAMPVGPSGAGATSVMA